MESTIQEEGRRNLEEKTTCKYPPVRPAASPRPDRRRELESLEREKERLERERELESWRTIPF